jgi:hypothetical protein
MADFLADTTDLLRRTPAYLRQLLAGLSAAWTETPDIAGGWRPRDVVGHLITAEATDWMTRIHVILEHGTAVPFEPLDREAMLDRDRDVALETLLDRFDALRTANLAELGSLVDPGDLARRGRHPALGEVTLGQLLAAWAVHDLDHIGQIHAGLAGSHDLDVGPWKGFLGILLRRDDPSAVAG